MFGEVFDQRYSMRNQNAYKITINLNKVYVSLSRVTWMNWNVFNSFAGYVILLSNITKLTFEYDNFR